jgi:hypothetical protein
MVTNQLGSLSGGGHFLQRVATDKKGLFFAKVAEMKEEVARQN